MVREGDRDTDRATDRQTDRQRDRETEKQRDRDRERERDRETETEREKEERDRETDWCVTEGIPETEPHDRQRSQASNATTVCSDEGVGALLTSFLVATRLSQVLSARRHSRWTAC
jgi:hypothetical protein